MFALASGRDSVDVGLMQVSWRYHRTALDTPDLALDPYRNLAIGARVLRDCHRRHGDWWQAVGCYHAPVNAGRAARYRERVRSLWHRLGRAEP